jgi:Phage derived protein Gp49-like (DUF891)
MRLFRYAHGSEWTVYLYCQGEDTCQILDVLTTCGDIGDRMLADLSKVAHRSLESLTRDGEFSARIQGTKLFEFRLPTSKGPTPRVAYFFDKDYVIVCALALLKKTEKLPQGFIDDAKRVHELYLSGGGLKAAHIEVYDEPSEDGEP